MNSELSKLLMEDKFPFTENVLIVDEINNSLLFNIFIYIINEISINRDYIYLNIDWHEHDGFINNSKKIKLSKLKNELSSVSDLILKNPKDFNVKLLFHSDDFKYFFRIYFFEDDNAYFDCILDEIIQHKLQLLLDDHHVNYSIMSASQYFKKIEAK